MRAIRISASGAGESRTVLLQGVTFPYPCCTRLSLLNYFFQPYTLNMQPFYTLSQSCSNFLAYRVNKENFKVLSFWSEVFCPKTKEKIFTLHSKPEAVTSYGKFVLSGMVGRGNMSARVNPVSRLLANLAAVVIHCWSKKMSVKRHDFNAIFNNRNTLYQGISPFRTIAAAST